MFDDRLRHLRESRGMTQKVVAEFLHINPRTYASYENNDREPNSEILIAIADLFNVSIDFLLGLPQKENSSDKSDILMADETEILNRYRQLNSDGKKYISTTMDMCLAYFREDESVFSANDEINDAENKRNEFVYRQLSNLNQTIKSTNPKPFITTRKK